MKQALLVAAITAGTFATAVVTQVESAQAFTLKINPTTAFAGSTPATGAAGELDFSFTNVGTNQVQLDLKVTNTTGAASYAGSAGATTSRLVGLAFDLPSLISSYTFNQKDGSSPLNRLFGIQSLTAQTVQGQATLNPFSNNPPAGYPGGGFDVGVRSGNMNRAFNGGSPSGGLLAGQSTLISFLLQGSGINTANQVEGLFYWGFGNVDGNGEVNQEPLRAALRFLDVNGDVDYNGETGEKLLATAEAVPTPALLPALLGLGASLLRKKKQAEQEASA